MGDEDRRIIQMNLVVADTGPLLHLCEIESIDLLRCFGGSIQATPIVLDEFRKHQPDYYRDFFPEWVIRVSVSTATAALANQWTNSGLVDPGEAEALAHAKHVKADLFLTDDSAARALAESMELESRGTLGVILYAAATGAITQTDAFRTLDNLERRSTLWMSARVKESARAAISKIIREP